MFRPVVSVLVMLLFCLATLSGCSRSLDARYSELPFDETQWKAVGEMSREQRSSCENRRANMVGDLVENHLQLGMTKDEIENLLGPRDGHTAPHPRQVGDGWIYRFTIEGFEDIVPWDASGSHYLVIRFDEDGKYVEHNIVFL